MVIGRVMSKTLISLFSIFCFILDKVRANDLVPELLDGERVKISNYNSVIEKLNKIGEDGSDRLQIIVDFDKTLSKYHSNGSLTASSHGIFEMIPTIPRSYVEGSQSLYKKYGPIEFDQKMTIEEKIPYMEEWWDEYEKLVEKLPFTYSTIEEAVIKYNIQLRDGINEAFEVLNEYSVPVLVFSAGLGDVIDSMVKLNHLKYNNVHIISNFFNYEDGYIHGFKGNRIHIFNKNRHAVENTDYFQELSERNNVILLGDSLGDSYMAEGVPGNGAILKIGFLNDKVEELLPSYLKHFDIVLIDDQTMDVFNAILRKVL